MKDLIFLLSFLCSFLGSAQTSVFQCGVIDPSVSQSDIDNSNYEYNKQCIEFEAQQPYLFDGDQNKKVTASEYVQINKDFHAGPFTQQGGLWMNIDSKSAFDVAVMNYSNLNNVLKYEKLELGVDLPDSIDQWIENFISEFPGNQVNPFLDWDLRVFAEFTHPSLNSPILVDGFYYKDYDPWMLDPLPVPSGVGYSDAEYASTGGYNEIPNDYNFRVRFAPTQLGLWNGKIKIILNESITIESNKFSFNVVESGNKGYMRVGENGRFFEFGQDSFYPVGCNIKWPITEYYNDSTFANNLRYWADSTLLNENWRPNYVVPRVYESYRNKISELVESGANTLRMILYPNSTDIEWEKLGDYSDRLHMAAEVDKTIEHFESLDAYVLFDMQIHYCFKEAVNTYNVRFSWDDTINGHNFCYRDLVGNDPIDFITDPIAKKYYKQKLRYIIARWGYSTSVSIFELFSEFNQIGSGGADQSDFYDNNWTIFRDWQLEMANYIKSHHNGNVHLVTASFSGDKHEDDDLYWYPEFDVMSSNIYDYGRPDFGKFWIDNVSKEHLNEDANKNSYTFGEGSPGYTRNIKPLIYSETDPIDLDTLCNSPSSFLELNRHLWQGVFSGVAGSFSWDFMERGYNYNYVNFQRVHNFISPINLDEDLWHPGAIKLDHNNNYKWEFKSNYAERMVGKNDHADLAYLRSGNKDYAIGIITNTTVNAVTIENCPTYSEWNNTWDPDLPLSNANVVSAETEKLKLKGMDPAKYIIDYYRPWDLSSPFETSQDWGPNVKIEKYLSSTPDNSFVLFKARKKGESWMNKSIDSIQNTIVGREFFNSLESNLTDTIIVYPNPAKDILNIIKRTQDDLELNILSLDGRNILYSTIKDYESTIFIENWMKGVYILEFRNITTGELKTFKIMKQ